MANKHYHLISTPVVEINGKVYNTQTWRMTLKELLETYYDKEIYIYGESVLTDEIRAVII